MILFESAILLELNLKNGKKFLTADAMGVMCILLCKRYNKKIYQSAMYKGEDKNERLIYFAGKDKEL